MIEGSASGNEAVAPGDPERWDLVQRIVCSRHLVKAPQLREILLYVARRSLAENVTAVNEQEIGCHALGRRPDFNPNEDNIVRVQVRHLRRKLEEYFATDGAGEPLVVTIPKGGYLAHFEPRKAEPEAQASHAEGPAAVQAPVAGRRPYLKSPVLWLLAALSAFGGLLAWRWPLAAGNSLAAAAMQKSAGDPLWSRIFVPRRKTEIVLADSCLVAVQDILDTDISLQQFVSGAYPAALIEAVPDPQLRAGLRLLADRQYTTLGDAAIASKLIDLGRRFNAEAEIRYSRFLSAREFKTGTFILVGSRRGIGWERLFEPQLNFTLEQDRDTRKYFFRNKAPASGELPAYHPQSDGNSDTYADIALLPNTGGTGYVLILAGIDMAGTEAAGELVAGQGFPDLARKLLAQHAGSIEVLLHAKSVAGTTQLPEIVASRPLWGGSEAASPERGPAQH